MGHGDGGGGVLQLTGISSTRSCRWRLRTGRRNQPNSSLHDHWLEHWRCGWCNADSTARFKQHLRGGDLVHAQFRAVNWLTCFSGARLDQEGTVGHAPTERPHVLISVLEKILRSYAEKKTDTVIVSAVGNNFDSLGEASDYYNRHSWEIGFEIRHLQ